ncbi:hypothetical protein D3C81_1374510 [compost metagenome]
MWPGRKANRIRLEFHFTRPMPVGIRLHTTDISLYCAPAVNLFEHGAEPLDLNGRTVDHRLVPMGLRPDAYEVFSVDEVNGWQRETNGKRGNWLRTYHPFESLQHEIEHSHGRTALYYRTRMESSHGIGGIQHRIAFIRADETDYVGGSETVSLSLTCTNRDLPLSLGAGDICFGTLGAINTPNFVRFRNITVPTPSYRPVLDGELQWNLISNLSLNYLSLLSMEPLRAVIRVYDFAALHDIRQARASRKRVDAILDATTVPADRLVRGLPIRGMRTTLRMDPSGFLCEGDLYLFCTVLSHFFSLYASINSFHVLEAVNAGNNEHYSWPMQIGTQPLI